MTVQPDPTDDDLTRIAGIGSRIAAQLRDAGIHTVDQLARATVDQVVAACGSRAATNARAQGWIEQAAELADELASPPGPDTAGRARPQQRRTFTVEIRVDGTSGQVVATRMVHLETQDAEAWRGWSRARVLDFLETRIGVADPEHSAAAAEPPVAPASALAPPAAEHATGPHPPAALAVHRFGLLRAATPAVGRGETAARLRLDPADLDLPAGRHAVAQVELLARPAGAGRAEVLDARSIDLAAGRAIDDVLRGQLPDRDPPFAVFAVVRVLIDQTSGRPMEGLGSATLELTPSSRPAG